MKPLFNTIDSTTMNHHRHSHERRLAVVRILVAQRAKIATGTLACKVVDAKIRAVATGCAGAAKGEEKRRNEEKKKTSKIPPRVKQ